ncbi:Beta-lactamase [Lysobacter dokdonensis DS-58]|uniref:Beta-lactamase n=1 Tax=Lysobacter dokdonensis DS-58 TaxID=1300345 RepID=A0A0A2WGG3_9GAMM|nr:Beta-lactamase [Lysobacter dokdonensis DS-58]
MSPFTAIAATPDPYAAIKADIGREIAAGRLTGVSIAVVKDGRIVHEDGFGWADREARTPATPHSAFSIASSTKPFTTTALMVLAADGKVDLDRPANDYLGEKLVDADGPAREATLRRIATHSAGLPTFFAMYPEDGPARQPSIATLIGEYGHLIAPVGERYEYSNLGMGLLAEVVARQSQQEYGAFLQSRVLVPLGMRNSFFDTDLARRKEMAARYADDGKRLPFYLTATPGSGELYASAHDMARFAMLHLGGQGLPRSAMILDQARLAELHRPQTFVAPHFHYGMGWQIHDAPGRAPVLYHGGGQSGVKAEFVLVPSANVAVIVLSNQRGPSNFINDVRDRLLKTVVPDWSTLPPPPAVQPIPLKGIAAYRGRWMGTLLAQGKHVPVVLAIAEDGTGTLSVGEGPARKIDDLGLVDGVLSGDSHGNVDSPDIRREGLEQLSLGLKLRGDTIDGEIVAWTKSSEHMAMYPFWTVLKRAPRP